MLRTCQLFVVGIAAFGLLLAVGCGGRPSITGTVKYDDGSIPEVGDPEDPSGKSVTVNFAPSSADGKHASASVRKDGTFTMTTGNEGKGVEPGDYSVTITIVSQYPPPPGGPPQVTPEPATVSVKGSQSIDFKIKKPAVRP